MPYNATELPIWVTSLGLLEWIWAPALATIGYLNRTVSENVFDNAYWHGSGVSVRLTVVTYIRSYPPPQAVQFIWASLPYPGRRSPVETCLIAPSPMAVRRFFEEAIQRGGRASIEPTDIGSGYLSAIHDDEGNELRAFFPSLWHLRGNNFTRSHVTGGYRWALPPDPGRASSDECSVSSESDYDDSRALSASRRQRQLARRRDGGERARQAGHWDGRDRDGAAERRRDRGREEDVGDRGGFVGRVHNGMGFVGGVAISLGEEFRDKSSVRPRQRR